MHSTGLAHLRVNNSDLSSSSISINSSDSGNSYSGNSTSRTLISSASSSSINSSYPSSVSSSRNGSISSGSSKSSSRALSKSSIVSTTSLLAEDLDDYSNLVDIGSMSNGFVSRVTVPFAPTHTCNIVPGKTGSLYIDTYNASRMYMDKGKVDKIHLNEKLHSPIWITPSTGNHTCLIGEAWQPKNCKCSLGNCKSDPPARRPDFTVMNAYRSPKPPQRCPCKFGTITILTLIFSMVMMLLILGFVIYTETVMKKPRVRIYYKM